MPASAFHVVTGPGRDRRATRSSTDPDVDGLTFTGSYEVGHGDLPHLRPRPPEAVDLRDGRQEPGHRQRHGRSRRRRRGHAALGVRAQRAEVLGRLARLRRAAGLDRVRRRSWSRQAEAIKVGDPLDRDVYIGPGHRRSGGRARSRRPSRKRRGTGQVFVGGDRIIDGDLARGNYLAADGRRGAARLLDLDERAVRPPHRGRRRSTRSTRRSTLANDTPFGLTAGFFSEDAGRGRPVPRTDRSRRRLHQPPRGRDDRRVAGRAAVRRLEGLGHQRQSRRRPVLRAAVPREQCRTIGGEKTT